MFHLGFIDSRLINPFQTFSVPSILKRAFNQAPLLIHKEPSHNINVLMNHDPMHQIKECVCLDLNVLLLQYRSHKRSVSSHINQFLPYAMLYSHINLFILQLHLEIVITHTVPNMLCYTNLLRHAVKAFHENFHS